MQYVQIDHCWKFERLRGLSKSVAKYQKFWFLIYEFDKVFPKKILSALDIYIHVTGRHHNKSIWEQHVLRHTPHICSISNSTWPPPPCAPKFSAILRKNQLFSTSRSRFHEIQTSGTFLTACKRKMSPLASKTCRELQQRVFVGF